MDRPLLQAAGNLGAMPARTMSEPGDSICMLSYTNRVHVCTMYVFVDGTWFVLCVYIHVYYTWK